MAVGQLKDCQIVCTFKYLEVISKQQMHFRTYYKNVTDSTVSAALGKNRESSCSARADTFGHTR